MNMRPSYSFSVTAAGVRSSTLGIQFHLETAEEKDKGDEPPRLTPRLQQPSAALLENICSVGREGAGDKGVDKGHKMMWMNTLDSSDSFVRSGLKLSMTPLFIEARLLKLKAALLFQESSEPYGSHSLYEENGKFKVAPLRFSFPGMPMDSCRGLCLFFAGSQDASIGAERKRQYNSRLHVVNPVTKQIQELPSLGNGCYMCCHLAYVHQSGEYKVVFSFSASGNYNWLIFTLGSDVSWRTLNAMPVPIQNMSEEVVRPISVPVGHFLYFSQCRRAIVAVNLCHETISSIQTPYNFIRHSFWLLKIEDRLCCVVRQGRVVHIWVLRNIAECEWIKYGEITLIAGDNMNLLFCLVGWLDNGQIFMSEFRPWIYVHKTIFIAHFAKTGRGKPIGFSKEVPFYCFLIHTNSLVGW